VGNTRIARYNSACPRGGAPCGDHEGGQRYNRTCAVRPTGGNLSGSCVGRGAVRGGAPRGDHEGGQVHQNAGPARHGLQDHRRPGLGERDDRCFLQESHCLTFFIGFLLSTTKLSRKSPQGSSKYFLFNIFSQKRFVDFCSNLFLNCCIHVHVRVHLSTIYCTLEDSKRGDGTTL
jgi:hypothetical protein